MLETNKIYQGDCLIKLKELKENSVDTVITDPPYGLEFMGKEWDRLGDVGRNRKKAIIKTSFGKIMGSNHETPRIVRTQRRKCEICGGYSGGYGKLCSCNNPQWLPLSYPLAMQQWHYNWAKEVLRVLKPGGTALIFGGTRTYHRLACGVEDAGFILKDCIMWLYGSGFPKATDISKQLDKNDKTDNNWDGWKSHGLKPAYEPILVAMKPNEGSYAENALKHGVSGLNIDGGRIGHSEPTKITNREQRKAGWNPDTCGFDSTKNTVASADPKGRFPANIILDDEVTDQEWKRFFYCAKASKSERNMGCEGLEEEPKLSNRIDQKLMKCTLCNKYKIATDFCRCENPKWEIKKVGNNHPTVKPLALMEYLCKLTKTPTGGIVLDPFMGSGTTGIACKKTGRDFIGIEKEKDYVKIAKRRIDSAEEEVVEAPQPELF